MPSKPAPSGDPAPPSRTWLKRNSALAAAEFGCAALALPFAGAAPFWPGAALGVAAALLWGWGGMAGVFGGTLLANAVLLRMGWRFAIMAALASTLAPMLGRALMRALHAKLDGWWLHARGTVAYALGMGVVMPLVSALLGAGALAVFDNLPAAATGDALLSWAVADAAAAMLLAPLLQQLWQRRGELRARAAMTAQTVQTAAVFALMAVVIVLLFATHALPPRDRAGLIGLLLLPAVWAIFALDAIAIVALLAFAYLSVVGGIAAGWPLMAGAASAGQQIAGISLLLLSAGAGLLLASALQAERLAALDALARLSAELDARAERRAQALVEQERVHRAQLVKLAEFRRVVSRVNQIIAQAVDERGLLQTFCDLLVELPDIALAWIGLPDAQQRFEVLASAGPARAYLDGLEASADAAQATGHGLAGRAWREQRALFDDDLDADPRLHPWRQRLHELGLRGAACLPLRRGEQPWAVLMLYARSPDGFDADWRELAVQLAADISRGLDRVDALQREHQALRVNAALLDNLSVGVALVRYPERALEQVNARLLDITGAADAGQLARHDAAQAYPEAEARERADALVQRVLRDGRGTLQDQPYQRPDGARVWLDVAGIRVDFGDGVERVLWTQIDVSQRHALTDDLGRMALFDPLTRLPNRRAIEQRLAGAIERANRHGTLLAVGMLDLDDFKPINDRYGHATGDALLRELAERLQQRMRGSDLRGRLGGDEFIVVLEDLDVEQLLDQLGALLERLHGALDAAFKFDSHPPLRIGMSMGLALYPNDARDADALLRAADIAMYQAKADKGTRARWWSLAGAPTTQPREAPFDPFGAEAQLNLRALAQPLDALATGYGAAFDARLGSHPDVAPLLASLADAERAQLHRTQADHIRFLLHPNTAATSIVACGTAIGRVHALSGLSAAVISNALALLHELLRRQLDAMTLPATVRYRTQRAADERLQLETQAELDAMQRVINEYNACLARPALPSGSWIDDAQRELEALGLLPGVLGAMVMRPRPDGVIAVELGAGSAAAEIAQLLSTPGLQPTLNPKLATGHGLARASWVSGAIERIDAYGHDPRSLAWADALRPTGLRSLAAIPVLGQRSEFVLMLFGAWRSQFAAGWMQTFLQSLQGRWLTLARRPNLAEPSLDLGSIAAWRELLYADGLRLHVQPIAELRDGSVAGVEALARLQQPDGRLVPPGRFLPALRDADLDALFRNVLAQALARLRDWRDAGLHLSISVNLPPSTLVHADCARWVDEALRHEGIAPQRLTLELVESQEFDERRRDEAIAELVRLGVKLAIDDLGAGYSSLLRLASLPFDVIKVDQGITREIRRAPIKTLSLIRTIVQIGADFDRKVVVEGVESDAVAEAVAVLGAQHVQGYAIARPMPADALAGWLREGWRPPSADGELHTWLGALAYHWYYTHQDNDRYARPVHTCPLGALLRAAGDAQALHWHELSHGAAATPRRAQARDQLQDWLIAQVAHDTATAT